MTSKQIFDQLCLVNYLRFTHKISNYHYVNIVIRQSSDIWVVKQTCLPGSTYNRVDSLDSTGIQQYIKSNRAEISRSLTEGREQS